MKKFCVLLALTLLSASTLIACGKNDTTADNIIQGEPIPEGDTSATTPDEEGETEPDVAPEEGMVRSFLSNEWIYEDVAGTRPVAVMFPTDKTAQPQYGISHADVLYECMEEGGISRQMGIIQDWESLDKIGNIRSCRLYYIFWMLEYDAILIHGGGIYNMAYMFDDPSVNNISGSGESGTGSGAPGNAQFFRTTDKKAPHNMFISNEGINNAIDSLGYTKEIREQYHNPDHFTFAKTTNKLEDGEDATYIDLSQVYPYSKPTLTYNEEEGVYYKTLHNEPQIDASNNEQLKFANVIVQVAQSQNLSNDPNSSDYKVFLCHDTTRGGYFFTQGKVIPIRWEKTSDRGATKYYDMDGNEIKLNTGKTYIAVSQEDRKITWK